MAIWCTSFSPPPRTLERRIWRLDGEPRALRAGGGPCRCRRDRLGADGASLASELATGSIVAGRDNDELYRYLAAEFDPLGLDYPHVLNAERDDMLADVRALYRGPIILNRPGRLREQVGADVAAGRADMETLGVMALSNPDVVEGLHTGAPLNACGRPCSMRAAVPREILTIPR